MTSQWMPRADWNALKSGETCPMCQGLANPELALPGHVDVYGHTIAALDGSILRLAADQYSLGYSILISTQHGPEIYDLDNDHRDRYFTDLTRATRAIATATGADKMNIEILGNLIPHTHAHLVPRRHNDPAPGSRFLRDHNSPVTLSPGEYASLASRITTALTSDPT